MSEQKSELTLINTQLSNLKNIADVYLSIQSKLINIGMLYEWKSGYCYGSLVKSSLKWYIEQDSIQIRFNITDTDTNSISEIIISIPFQIIHEKLKSNENIIDFIIEYCTFDKQKKDKLKELENKMDELLKPNRLLQNQNESMETEIEVIEDMQYTKEYKQKCITDLEIKIEQNKQQIIKFEKEIHPKLQPILLEMMNQQSIQFRK